MTKAMATFAWLTLATAALTGCGPTDSTVIQNPKATTGTYRDSLVMTAAQSVLSGPYASAPNRVRAAYSDCVADYMIAGMTPDERQRSEAFTMGDSSMTIGEWKALDKEITDHLGGPLTYASLDRLSGTCPDKVADFKRYFGPGFNGL